MKHSLFRPASIACGIAAILVLAPTWFTFGGEPGLPAFSSSGFGLTGVVPGQDHSPTGAVGVLMVLVCVVAAIALLTIPPDDKAALVLAGAGLIATGILLADRGPRMSGVSPTWAPFVAAAIWLVAVFVCRTAHDRSKTPRKP
ncbi:hypothetical protein [Streptomyces sp. SID13031]|uniref:hypothetical protein n=1 Tax=Streptomyces sp. SID13031 TaxID=2706046 RepID=UPI0013C742C5|nr:hypothetical protein [Streptomyces sp. SID13031]NEA35307.1 hypothetical protein [Streptomyces sp. SID13031]